MNKIKYSREIGRQIALEKRVCCPVCSDSSGDQPMSCYGDDEYLLFCPHCDRTVKLITDPENPWISFGEEDNER